MAVGTKVRKFTSDEDVEKSKRLTFSDLLIPFLAVIAFIILTVFVYIPQLQSALNYYDEIHSLKKDEVKLSNNLNTLNDLEDSQSELLVDLSAAKSVIPNKLSVSDFTFGVDDLAKEYNLSLQSISSSDIGYADSEDTEYATGIVKGITGPLSYEGSFGDVTDFLERIKLSSPYLIETSDIQTSRLDDMDRWRVDLAVTGYYFVENQYKFKDYTIPITDYHTKSAFLDEIKSRSQIINNDQ